MLKQLGSVLLGLGAAVFFGGGGLPPRGFEKYPILLEEYRKAKQNGHKPTMDQQGAYNAHCFYIVGKYLMVTGVIIYLSSYIFG